MPRIVGTDIPDRKPLRVALTYIFGVGPNIADALLEKTELDGSRRAETLTEEELVKISGILEADYIVEGTLRRQVSQNVQRLRDIRCYRGDRHRRGLPCRGQRTQTNARTRKGRKKTVAGKKSVKGMK
jgi:small subunit ribosomal protein S13